MIGGMEPRLLSRPPPRPRFLFRWLLPACWAALCVFGFEHPGDTYALFALGSFAGIWAGFFVGSPPGVAGLLLPVLLAGGLVMLLFGWMLDRLRAGLWLWLGSLLVVAAVTLLGMLASFPDLDAAIRTHGSILAFAACALQIGGYAAVLVGFLGWLFGLRPERHHLV
jgi:hypothetical protein